MPSFTRSTFSCTYQVPTEVAHLRRHRRTREIPQRPNNQPLITSWNISNFGEQLRRDSDRQLLAGPELVRRCRDPGGKRELRRS